MNEWQIALAIGATIVALITWQLDRAWLWILAGAVSFVASTAWARHGLPYPAAFTALCDAAVCLLIFLRAERAWELYLYRIFQASVFVSIVYFGWSQWGAPAGARYAYISILELLNWAALLLILGTGIMQHGALEYGAGSDAAAPRFVRWSRRALFAHRTASS